ncbi:hypothetical protein EC973_001310 [Apophysomyces ossiformis]|uniref:RING-type E3 ubiquitin transferase n=1 Tax=Apophysomyces ossiformis TaxID=679940 RepID=A0A8H7EPE6_9FUNG|nr:hypothetical protein EC973_001310 [Apophysomyces ossiformis]
MPTSRFACKGKRKRSIEDEEEDEESASKGPICSICMQPYTNRTFIRSCFHSFCFVCIRQWINIATSCPLCKQPIEHLVYNIDEDKNTYQEYSLADKAKDGKHDPPPTPPSLTPQERLRIQRSHIYRSPTEAIYPTPPSSSFARIQCISPENMPRAAIFIERELPALMGELYDPLVETHIKNILLIPYQTNLRSKSRNVMKMDDSEIIQQLSEWISDNEDDTIARRFIRELMAFIRSGHNYNSFVSNSIYKVQSS